MADINLRNIDSNNIFVIKVVHKMFEHNLEKREQTMKKKVNENRPERKGETLSPQ